MYDSVAPCDAWIWIKLMKKGRSPMILLLYFRQLNKFKSWSNLLLSDKYTPSFLLRHDAEESSNISCFLWHTASLVGQKPVSLHHCKFTVSKLSSQHAIHMCGCEIEFVNDENSKISPLSAIRLCSLEGISRSTGFSLIALFSCYITDLQEAYILSWSWFWHLFSVMRNIYVWDCYSTCW